MVFNRLSKHIEFVTVKSFLQAIAQAASSIIGIIFRSCMP